MGNRIGWITPGEVFLDGRAVYAAVKIYADAQGQSLPVSESTLWKRIKDRGLFSRVGDSKNIAIRVTVAGSRRRVYAVRSSILEAPGGDSTLDYGSDIGII